MDTLYGRGERDRQEMTFGGRNEEYRKPGSNGWVLI
jgi:hypothetical protein